MIARLEWTHIDRNDVYSNLKGITLTGSNAITLLDRGKSSSVVGVHKPGDARIKLFLESSPQTFTINMGDTEVEFERKTNNLMQARIVSLYMLDKILNKTSVNNDKEISDRESIDACIEGIFPEENDERIKRTSQGYLIGDFIFPYWMGEDIEIAISPINTGGGAYGIHLYTPNCHDLIHKTPYLRVNNSWCLVGIGNTNKKGTWWLTAPPDELSNIREYDGVLLPDDNTLPIRSRRQVWSLFRRIGPWKEGPVGKYLNLSFSARKEAKDWSAAAQSYEYGLIGFSTAIGQARYYRDKESINREIAVTKRKQAQKLYENRAKAYIDYNIEDYAEELKHDRRYKYVGKWLERAKLAEKHANNAATFAESIEERMAEKRQQIEDAEQVILPFERKYENEIREMY